MGSSSSATETILPQCIEEGKQLSLDQQETSFDSKKAVWCKLSTPKHRFIMWQMVHSNLLTRDNLVKKHVSMDSAYCPSDAKYQEVVGGLALAKFFSIAS
ncbi:hypothetical protein G4B88_013243 [Cannabis sativa]|uniref:Reverse transcriptase zinc-binding domain-containing protein n=1 Tax=Cannabis sativa TaxID=3483 RepID=A0A7J6GZN9_CANSA|nr:hypothetical protein G4B88_013243 [Cannabis sativa]